MSAGRVRQAQCARVRKGRELAHETPRGIFILSQQNCDRICGREGTEAIRQRVDADGPFGQQDVLSSPDRLRDVEMIFSLKHGWQQAHRMRRNRSTQGRHEPPGAYGTTVAVISLGVIGRGVCSRLAALDNVILAPHIARQHGAGMPAYAATMVEELDRYPAGQPVAWEIDEAKSKRLA